MFNKALIPNALTMGNLLCGVLALRMLSSTVFTLDEVENPILIATFFIGIAVVFDLLDGLVARALKVSSPLGAQLDSLADMVTFGVVPALMLWTTLADRMPDLFPLVLPCLLAMPVAAAYRLGRFNLGKAGDTKGFNGLATPAAAMFIVALSVGISKGLYIDWEESDNLLYMLMVCLAPIITALLMASRLPLLALKFYKGIKLHAHITLLVLGLAAVFALGWKAAVPVLLLYLAVSAWHFRWWSRSR